MTYRSRFQANVRHPLLSPRLPLERSRALVFILTLCFILLLLRAAWIAGPNNAFYKRQGDIRVRRQLAIPAKRGRLLDRNGTVLAEDLPAGAVYAVPAKLLFMPELQPRYEKLAALLHLPFAQLQTAKQSQHGFVYLSRQVPPELVGEVLALDLPGIYIQDEVRRAYPQDANAFGALIGRVNPDGMGTEGLELALQSRLAATQGSRIVERDRMGRPVGQSDWHSDARDGEDVTLSIDARLQAFAYQVLAKNGQAFRAKSALAVIADVHTGEILAAVSWSAAEIGGRALEPRRNRVMTDAFEPGSIIKPVIVASALELNRVTPDTILNTNGVYEFQHARITDVRNFGNLTIAGVIEKSSNIGMVKIATQLTAEELMAKLEKFGFGRRPSEVIYPGLSVGHLPKAKNLAAITQATMSYGYGFTASPLQLVHAFSIFGNGGLATPLTLERHSPTSSSLGLRVLSDRTAGEILHMLELVTGDGGSGKQAKVAGYRVGGKTGTAYLHVPGHGYDKRHYRASFVGLAPMSAPDIAVVVSVEDPTAGSHYGGKVAAPICSKIIAQTLYWRHILPDIQQSRLNDQGGFRSN